MADYIPKEEAALVVWFADHAAGVNTHGVTVGLSPADVTQAAEDATTVSHAVNGRSGSEPRTPVRGPDAREAHHLRGGFGPSAAPRPTFRSWPTTRTRPISTRAPRWSLASPKSASTAPAGATTTSPSATGATLCR